MTGHPSFCKSRNQRSPRVAWFLLHLRESQREYIRMAEKMLKLHERLQRVQVRAAS